MKDRKNKIIENSKENTKKQQVLRCINIDCVFNSSNQYGAERNFCTHPRVSVESRFADITVAICSEFRSKKDYELEKPSTVIDLKTGEKTEIIHTPEIGITPVEKVTTAELEESIAFKDVKHPEEQIIVPTFRPQIIESKPEEEEELSFSEKYNLTDNPKTDFLILRKIYQPNTKKGFIGSVLIHFVIIFFMYQFIVPKEEDTTQPQQRIVVVEDLEMPKFDPPDLDKLKEEEKKEKEIDETKDVRPKINKKVITPKINRPKDNTVPPDTNKIAVNDSNKVKSDSLFATGDTTRLQLPDSLKSTYSENAIGMSLWYPKNWKLTDNRTVNLNQEQFKGVIINTDSLSEDPGAVTIFIQIDDPQHSAFNKAVYKNLFQMDDSTATAYVTDPNPTGAGAKRITMKYFIFTDQTSQKNVFVNTEVKKDFYEKYKPYIDAIVRSIKIVSAPKSEK
ncbi:MAG TPA: hypothetical protein VGK25_00290 [Ignavibacteria bacterium]